MSQESNNIHRSYLYTNWRGMTFIIDQDFVDRLKQSLREEGSKEEDMNWITPETILRDLPEFETLDRMEQLEQMWEQLLADVRIAEQSPER